MQLRLHFLRLFLLLFVVWPSYGSFFSRMINIKSTPPRKKQWNLKSTMLRLTKTQYVRYSVIGGGSIALFELMKALRISPIARNIGYQSGEGSMRGSEGKMAKQDNFIAAQSRSRLNETEQLINQRMLAVVKNMQDIEYRLKLVERSVREIEYAYNASMSKFEAFGESLLDDTEARATSLQAKMEADVSVLKAAVSDLRSEVPRLIQQYEQKVMKTIQGLSMRPANRTARSKR